MISINIVFLILLSHWIADFVCQTDAMAKGKSSDWRQLVMHITAYTTVINLIILIVMFCMLMPPATIAMVILWGYLNGAIHFCVDAVTSRITSKLYSAGRIHDFFVVIGFDQLIHTICLLGTWLLIFGTF